ncbi:unnamed protein product [Candidula unifasciata]|uniref:PHTF1/2 N-terminal domain-containing protein n=1 Tax=Candidula unifasciata TaxID=100452 RepID=A0A8S3ZX87_9EUPU|nr:unnamed protein product [Candidula unifasciata]
MDSVHTAIAWYQTKIGAYDKQLWEQSVEKKLQKQPQFVLHSAPRKKVRLKTEYIDVDLIQGSSFTKSKPQVPWVYITRKAVARVVFFPFYYHWWVHQTSKRLYYILMALYILQVVTVLVYVSNFDSIEDELSFTEVIVPVILMFLLCLIHSQTVLAHINHKPPKPNKTISGVIRKPRLKRPSRRTRSSDNNSTCLEEDGNTGPSKKSGRPSTAESLSSKVTSQKCPDPVISSSIDMESSLMSRSVSDYDLKPAINSTQNEIHPAAPSFVVQSHKNMLKNEARQPASRHSERNSCSSRESGHTWDQEANTYNPLTKWGDGSTDQSQAVPISGCSYNLLDNLPNLLTVEKIVRDVPFENKSEETINEPVERVSCRQQGQISDVSAGQRNLNFDLEEQIDKEGINSDRCENDESHEEENEKLKLCCGFVESSHMHGTSCAVDNDGGWDVSDCKHSPETCGDKGEPVDIIGGASSIDKRSYSFDTSNKCLIKTSVHSLINEDVCSDSDKNNQPGANIKTCRMTTHNLLADRNRLDCRCKSPKGHPSCTNNHSSSHFELIDHHVVYENTIADCLSGAALSTYAVPPASSQTYPRNVLSHLGPSATSTLSLTATVSSSSCETLQNYLVPSSSPPTPLPTTAQKSSRQQHHQHHNNDLNTMSQPCHLPESFTIHNGLDDEKNDLAEESLEQVNFSEGERHTDDLSNYNASDSDDVDTDGSQTEVPRMYEEKWKRLRFQEQASESECPDNFFSEDSRYIESGTTATAVKSGRASTRKDTALSKTGILSAGSESSRLVVGILTRQSSPLKDLTMGRKAATSRPVITSSGSDKGQSEPHNPLRRRRRTSGNSHDVGETSKTRSVPCIVGVRHHEAKKRHISSSENEAACLLTPEESNKATLSSEEWEDRIQSDETTSSAYSSNSEIDSEEKVQEEADDRAEYTSSNFNVINLLQPQTGSPTSLGIATQPDRVSCLIWERNECKKTDLTALDIGWAIIDKVDSLPGIFRLFYYWSVVPLAFRAYANKDLPGAEDFLTWPGLVAKLAEFSSVIITTYSWRQLLLMFNGIVQRIFLSLIFFFLLCVADRTFKQRLLYAKHFSYLTSFRRARKFSMPHFRLNKVRNIKIWLSLRSYLKRRGPQRSVDVIVSACFLVAVSIVCLVSIQMLKDTVSFLDYLCNWELLVWCIALAVFLMRFMTLGLKINKKYGNLSVLITEQINLYLQMEQKPHKKEELILANNVLRLAEDLLKELESPFKISGFSANPLIYNILRVVVLSAFSAVLTEVLGFKLKLHKIKLKG